MTRQAFDAGERVQWPDTTEPAGEDGRCLTVADRLDTRYKSGNWYFRYLYKEMAERMVEDMKANVSEEFDNVLLVTGKEGSGKSNLTYFIAKLFDPEFDIRKSLVYSWQEFLESVSQDTQKVYWFDEAVLVAAGRDWMKESNRMLIKSLQIIRSFRLTIIFNIPSIDSVDVYIRTFRTRYLLKAQEMRWSGDKEARRGYAELRIPLSKEERERLPKNSSAEMGFKSIGFFKFPRMEGEDKRIYDETKLQAQKATLNEMLEQMRESGKGKSRDKKSLEALVSYLSDTQGLKYAEIADIAGMPYNTVKTMAWRVRKQRGDDE